MGIVSSFFAVPALLLLKGVLTGRVDGTVAELDLALDVDGGARDGRGRRLLFTDATIPSRGLVICPDAFAYRKQVS